MSLSCCPSECFLPGDSAPAKLGAPLPPATGTSLYFQFCNHSFIPALLLLCFPGQEVFLFLLSYLPTAGSSAKVARSQNTGEQRALLSARTPCSLQLGWRLPQATRSLTAGLQLSLASAAAGEMAICCLLSNWSPAKQWPLLLSAFGEMKT